MPEKDLPYKNKGDLTTGSVKSHLIRLTIPMIWGLFAVISVQLADTYFISLLGTEELAGISFTFPVTMLITHLIFGLNIAIASVVSRLIGEKKMEDTKRVTLHGIMMAFVFSLIIAVICYVLLEPLFILLGATDETLPYVMAYMPLWLVASVLLSIPVPANSAMRAGGDAFTPALIMVTIAVINCILDPVLIFGYFGAPSMGVKGAALSTLIAYGAGLCAALYVLTFIKDMVPRDGPHLNTLKDSFKRLVVIAIPAGIANIIMPFTNAVIVAILAGYGAEAVAAFGVASRIEAFAFLAVISLAVGMAPVIGQNWGAKIYDRVHQTINMSIRFNFIWSFLVAIILGVFARQIAGTFSNDPQVIEYASLFFWIVPFSYAFGNLVFGWSSAFNAMGMPKRSFVMIFVKALVLTVPAVFIGSNFYGVTGIFIALALVNLVSGLYFHIISWRVCLQCEKDA